jgi:alpha-D-ribose 1-methylphosphonate 5-triphosphate synthase subunit PhnL
MNEEQKLKIEESFIDLKLNVRGVNTILASLAKQSYEVVAELINEIRSQGTSQVGEIEKAILAEIPEVSNEE